MFGNNDSLRLSTTIIMDDPNDRGFPTSRTPRFRIPSRFSNGAIVAIFLVLSVIYAGFLITRGVSYASSSDASGYFNSAQLLASAAVSTPIKTIPHFTPTDGDYYYQQPLGFSVVNETISLVPTYPPGLPLHLLIAAQVVGWDHAAILVNVLGALLSGWLTFLLARKYCHLSPAWALAATLLLWTCPLFVFFSLQPMSDMPSTGWCLLAFFSALNARQRVIWGLLAGVAVGIAVLLRPTNLFVMLPVLIILRGSWKAWGFLILGGLPFAVIQIAYNLKTYGEILTTGYGDVSTLLQSEFVAHNSIHFAQWIPRLLTPAIILAGAIPWLLDYYPRLISAMIAWIVALITFYTFYYHAGETWWYLRFILPVFPFLILAALMVGQRLAEFIRNPWLRAILPLAILGTALSSQYHMNSQLDVTHVKPGDRAYFDTNEWLLNNVSDDAIIVAMQASGSLHYYTEYPLVRYDVISPEKLALVFESARQHGQPIYAPLFPFEIEAVVTAKLGGNWEQVATIGYITIWKLKG
jgi:hypothetical protein